MKKIIIYTTEFCPYCVQAKRLLESKSIPFEEKNLENDPAELKALKERTGMRTVPQIFIGEDLIGGYTELSQIDQSGELDQLLNS